MRESWQPWVWQLLNMDDKMSVAIKEYVQVMGVEVEPAGLVVSATKIYIEASPNGIVSCSCCGRGCVEIKCPLSVAHTIRSADVLAYLAYKPADNTQTLSRTHKYYSQVKSVQGKQLILMKVM